MPKIQFAFLSKEPRNYKEGDLIPIYMRVGIAGKRIEFTTHREWNPNKWNKAAGRASGTKEASKDLNAYLDTLQNKIYEGQRRIIDEGGVVSTESIRDIIVGRNRNSKMLLEVFDYHNKQCQNS